MYTDEQVMEGILAYMRAEVLPQLPGAAKVVIGAMILHNSKRIGDILKDSRAGGFLRTIDLLNDDGCIDADTWCQELKNSMQDFCGGRLELQLPMLSPIIFNAGDVDLMKRYIKGELR